MLLSFLPSILVLVLSILLGFHLWRQQQKPSLSPEDLEIQHRAMLESLHEGLHQQSERLMRAQADAAERLHRSVLENGERLRDAVKYELSDTRRVLLELQNSQQQSLEQLRSNTTLQLQTLASQLQEKQEILRSDLISKTLQLLTEQNRASLENQQNTLKQVTESLTQSIGALTLTVEQRLDLISGKVNERLDEGFKKTNETFANVMARLATIDEAQKKIDGLTTNVVSLQELLGDKRSRGAFGEVQLAALVHNLLPAQVFTLQASLPNGTRVDCLLHLPAPTGELAIDSKFPMENYQRLIDRNQSDSEQRAALSAFKADVKKHIQDIANKYIIPGVTTDGAIMFIPAEAVFAEIHAYHPDLVKLAQDRGVWITSPTTLMAILNTARAVIRDVETRNEVHVIQEALRRLSEEFRRFDTRMKKLADHIRQAHEDAQSVQTTSDKISRQFTRIDKVQLDGNGAEMPLLLEDE